MKKLQAACMVDEMCFQKMPLEMLMKALCKFLDMSAIYKVLSAWSYTCVRIFLSQATASRNSLCLY